MVNQVIEGHFRNSIKAMNEDIFIDKIQVNPHAFTSTAGDFQLQTVDLDIIVECKQVSMKNRKTKPLFVLSRLTQEAKMVEYMNRFKRNKAYVFVVFWANSKKSSNAYLISIQTWLCFSKLYNKSTIGAEEFSELFGAYEVKTDGKNWLFEFY